MGPVINTLATEDRGWWEEHVTQETQPKKRNEGVKRAL